MLFAGSELVAELEKGKWEFNGKESNIKDVITLFKLAQFKKLMEV